MRLSPSLMHTSTLRPLSGLLNRNSCLQGIANPAAEQIQSNDELVGWLCAPSMLQDLLYTQGRRFGPRHRLDRRHRDWRPRRSRESGDEHGRLLNGQCRRAVQPLERRAIVLRTVWSKRVRGSRGTAWGLSGCRSSAAGNRLFPPCFGVGKKLSIFCDGHCSVQHLLPGQFLIDVAYVGNRAAGLARVQPDSARVPCPPLLIARPGHYRLPARPGDESLRKNSEFDGTGPASNRLRDHSRCSHTPILKAPARATTVAAPGISRCRYRPTSASAKA